MARDEDNEARTLMWVHRKRMEELDRARMQKSGRYLEVREVKVIGLAGDLTRQSIVVDAAYGPLDRLEVEEVLRRHLGVTGNEQSPGGNGH